MKIGHFIILVISLTFIDAASILAPKKVPAPIVVAPPKNKRQQNGEYYIPTSGLHQYTHVKYPQVFEWGYRRGDPLTHVRSQVFNQQGSSFNSAVRMIFTRQFLFVFTLNLKIEVCSRQNFSCCFISKPFREFRALFCFENLFNFGGKIQIYLAPKFKLHFSGLGGKNSYFYVSKVLAPISLYIELEIFRFPRQISLSFEFPLTQKLFIFGAKFI